MVEEGDLDDKLEDKATNKVVDDVKKVAIAHTAPLLTSLIWTSSLSPSSSSSSSSSSAG